MKNKLKKLIDNLEDQKFKNTNDRADEYFNKGLQIAISQLELILKEEENG